MSIQSNILQGIIQILGLSTIDKRFVELVVEEGGGKSAADLQEQMQKHGYLNPTLEQCAAILAGGTAPVEPPAPPTEPEAPATEPGEAV
jgi:hypothetical protein